MSKFAFPLAAVFLFISGFFVAKVPDATRPELAGVSSIFVLLLALPSYIALLRWLGARHGVLLLLALGIFAVGIEIIAVKTGFPYGEFTHGEKIGWKFFDAVPWTVPFAWTPLILCSATLAKRAVARIGAPEYSGVVLSALILVAIDMVLDPGSVAQEFWTYRHGGLYYGVPLSNFLGWLFSGLIASAIFFGLVRNWGSQEKPPSALGRSTFLILVFWTSICLWMELWLPSGIGVLLTVLVGRLVFVRKAEHE